MSAPVRIESEAFTDPRFELLGKLLGSDRYQALGTMLYMWSWATEHGRHAIPEPIATMFGLGDGRIEMVVKARLGQWVDCDSPGECGDGCRHLRLKGTKGRIEWLSVAKATRVAGGKARMANAVRDAFGRVVSPAESQQPTSSHPGESSVLTLSPSLSPDLDPGDQDLQRSKRSGGVQRGSETKVGPPKKRKSRPSDHTPEEKASAERVLQRLSERNGVAYTSVSHVALVIARLRDGVSESELRAVVSYCAHDMGWVGHPTMEQYLRPQTLFGPQNIAKYLDPARTRYAKAIAKLNAERNPQLELVKETA